MLQKYLAFTRAVSYKHCIKDVKKTHCLKDQPPVQSTFLDLEPYQLSFIQRTYAVLFLALAAMTICGVFSYFILPPVAKLPLLILDALIWVACGWFGLRNPIKAIFPLFVVITGLALGQIAQLYHPDTFFAAGILTLVAFAATSSYVLKSRKDFSFLAGFLKIGFWVLLALMVLLIFIQVSLLSAFLGLFGTAVFIGWILYDTSQIIYRADHAGYSPQLGAFDLFMDMIGLFSFVRHLFNLWDD